MQNESGQGKKLELSLGEWVPFRCGTCIVIFSVASLSRLEYPNFGWLMIIVSESLRSSSFSEGFFLVREEGGYLNYYFHFAIIL